MHMLIRHKVADFAKWKPVYDAHLPARQKAGLKEEHLSATPTTQMKCCCFSRWKISIRRKHSPLRTICARPWRRPESARSRTFIFSNSGFKPFNNCQNLPAFDLARFNRLPKVLQPLTRRCDSKKEKGSELTIDTKWTILPRHFCHQSLNFIHIRSTETRLYLKE